jgi:quercetin dioxygenase-like cupin family protein
MINAVTDNNPSKVRFRENIINVQEGLLKMIAEGVVKDTLPDCKLTHYYSPVDENYGCGTYARQMFIPKGTLIIGKIHRHQHLNFIMQGKVSVSTEFGPKYFEAPCIFVSEVGLKRAVVAEEDTLWVTVHITKHLGEENLAKMEEEVIAPSYKELGLIDLTKNLITEN